MELPSLTRSFQEDHLVAVHLDSDLIPGQAVSGMDLDALTREACVAGMDKPDAVLRRFETIGEAASRPSPDTRALFPNLPFRGLSGMHNTIAHAGRPRPPPRRWSLPLIS